MSYIAEITFFFSPSINYSKSLDLKLQVYNGSTELTIEIVCIDKGTPLRGQATNVTVNISNTCLVDETFGRTNFSFTLNISTGEIYLRIPGYWIVDFRKSKYDASWV